MELMKDCMDIIRQKGEPIKPDSELGLRIACPEYSIDRIDVKTFPLPEEDIFILCWNMETGGSLHAALMPCKQPLSYSRVFTPGGRTQYHTHDYIELAYIVDGRFRQKIMDKEILFQKGELCLIDKNCPHQDFLEDNNSTILFIGLAHKFFDEVMVENIGEEKLLSFLRTALMRQKDISQYLHFKPKNPEDKKLEELLLQLLAEMNHHDAASRYICKGLVIRILNYISTMYDFLLSSEQKKKMNWLIHEEIIRYIEENYARITIKDLTARFHFNEDYYNRLIKEMTGMTYHKYVQEIRLKNAQRLLKTTDMTVEEVADLVGYQNKGYFYKIFTEKYDVTPAKFRK